ncbi:MAG: Ig-like domain-containing protein, partial [Clostridia bacterium]|nr:Ig-like domain-containing protein [Clostridia bacterium]
DAAVTWSVVKGGDIVSVENGTVTSLGKYGTATVRATSVKDPDAYADFTVTVPDPYGDWIQIFDRASLENALKSGNENKNMYLTCDIDLGGAEINSTIGNYAATIEGRGYEIKNFSCSNGLFGGITASAVITDLAITCRSGKQSGDVHRFDGLFGQFILGRMENCRFDVTVLQDSQSALAHHSDPNATIKNVILLVRNPQNKNEIFPCFFLEATCENVYCAVVEGSVTGAMNGAQPKTEAQLKEASLYAGWDSDIWLIEDGEIPVLQNDNTGVRVGLSQKEATIYAGETLALTATVKPDKLPLEEKGIIWTSSNENVATVDGNGVVTALKAGTAVITATSEKDPAKFATCTVTVNAVEISINSEDIEMKRGATKQLSVTVNHGGYVWVSSDESIATVEDGLVRAVGDGTVTITVRSLLDYSVTDFITITVNATINLSVTLSDSTLALDRDASATLTATVKGSDSGVSWTSSDESVASVDENGVVTSHGKNGTAIITATTIEDNGAGDRAVAECTVTVEYVAAKITVEETAFTLPLGGALTLADIATASKGEFTLSLKGGSSDGIVSLGNDTITAVSEGEVTVLLTWSIDYADIDDVEFELSITVFIPAVELSINAERLALKAGESSNARILQVTMDVMPASPKAEDITWASGDASVVEVASAGYANGSYTGTLKAKGEGITVITATYTIGGIEYKVTCDVAVFNATGSWTAVYDLNSFKQVWGTPGNYYLAHDLDLNGATVDRTREDYNAVFDGRGFTVSNFTTKSLFMYNNTGSVIENVKLVCTLNNNGANEGIFGHHGNGGTIKNCYLDVTFGTNLAAISPALMNHINNAIYENVIVATHNPNQKSGVRADFFEAGGTVTNMICYREDNSIIAPQKGTAKTEAQLKTAVTFEGWDGWVATDGEYP